MTPIRALLLALPFLIGGCEVEVKVTAGNSEKSDLYEKPWQKYATHKETRKLELWWSWHDSRDECLNSLNYDLTSSIHATWYTEPAGCMYVGSDSKYALYLMNKIYNPRIFMCVAGMKNAGEGSKRLRVITNGYPKETGVYRCILPT